MTSEEYQIFPALEVSSQKIRTRFGQSKRISSPGFSCNLKVGAMQGLHEFIPAFLSNDILRLWRTFCVNYEANTRVDPPEKKAKRKVKNYKLKHSRLLTCYSAIVYLLAIFKTYKTVTPDNVRHMIKLRPTERLVFLLRDKKYSAAHKKINELITRYERFLERSAVREEELIKQFLDKDKSKEFFIEANAFGNVVFEVLKLIGRDERFFRLLMV